MSGTHERMKEIETDPTLFAQWGQANFAFAYQEFGQENIVRFTLHRDEKTPHFHCVFVPITPAGGLSAKHFMDRKKGVLRAYQDRYATAMDLGHLFVKVGFGTIYVRRHMLAVYIAADAAERLVFADVQHHELAV